jgi:hypothetical protein
MMKNKPIILFLILAMLLSMLLGISVGIIIIPNNFEKGFRYGTFYVETDNEGRSMIKELYPEAVDEYERNKSLIFRDCDSITVSNVKFHGDEPGKCQVNAWGWTIFENGTTYIPYYRKDSTGRYVKDYRRMENNNHYSRSDTTMHLHDNILIFNGRVMTPELRDSLYGYTESGFGHYYENYNTEAFKDSCINSWKTNNHER